MKKFTSHILILFLLGLVYQSHAQVQYSGCSATGANASAIGKQTTASGNNSFAAGYASQATGSNSMAFGYNSKATQSTTTAVGNTAIASGNGSMALGNYVKATAQNAFVFGTGTTASYPLTNSTANSIAFGVNSNKPTLLITKSLNNNYTGKVAIGAVTEPQAKLHIRSDNNEDAGVKIEPTDKNGHKAFIKLFDDAHYITVDNTANMELNTGTGSMKIQGNALEIHAPQTTEVESANITFSGKVGINTVNNVDGYALAVDGGLISTKVYIKEVKQWPDYVFADDYPLMGLEDLKLYLTNHRHLPGLPCEKEILDQGYDLNEMQSAMLQKIEELTRYILFLHDEIDALKRDSVVFTYDSNGNRITRSLVFERLVRPSSPEDYTPSAYTLFPNPTSDEFTLHRSLPDKNAIIHAFLFGVKGNILDKKESVDLDITFDLSKFPEGIYFLEVEGPEGHETWKVIKK